MNNRQLTCTENATFRYDKLQPTAKYTSDMARTFESIKELASKRTGQSFGVTGSPLIEIELNHVRQHYI